jgi:hypothetical protein
MPGEEWQEHLSPERAEAVQSWLSTPLNTCRLCQQPVFPTDPRKVDKKFRPPPPPPGEETPMAKFKRETPDKLHLACAASDAG